MRAKAVRRIGVIADTHGVFDPAIKRYFGGVDHIIHAGDIGSPAVIEQLQTIAPVTAVSGNVDRFENSGFSRETVMRCGGVRIGIRHIVYEKGAVTEEAKAWLERERPDLCIFGHSHKPTAARYGRTLLFNPGSAGPRRFSLPRGLGIVTIVDRQLRTRFLRLADRIEVPHRRGTASALRKGRRRASRRALPSVD